MRVGLVSLLVVFTILLVPTAFAQEYSDNEPTTHNPESEPTPNPEPEIEPTSEPDTNQNPQPIEDSLELETLRNENVELKQEIISLSIIIETLENEIERLLDQLFISFLNSLDWP